MSSPDVNFCLLPAQAEPPLGVGNLGMAVSTEPQETKATAPTCNHPRCVMASTPPVFVLCQQVLSLMGSERPGAVPTRQNAEAILYERRVESHGQKLCHFSSGPGKGSWPVLLTCIKADKLVMRSGFEVGTSTICTTCSLAGVQAALSSFSEGWSLS